MMTSQKAGVSDYWGANKKVSGYEQQNKQKTLARVSVSAESDEPIRMSVLWTDWNF